MEQIRVIAEIGSNWLHFEDCIRSIDGANECGADFVKFQLYTSQELYGGHGPLTEGVLPAHWIIQLSNYAASKGIGFLCTAFSAEGYRKVDPFVSMHKIASSELTDINILRQVNKFRKPVLLSVGGSPINEIGQALRFLQECDITIMYCVADYPAKVINLRGILNLYKKFGPRYNYGYSDHSLDVLIIAKEVFLTCEMITGNQFIVEKHVTFIKDITPDSVCSLTKDEFKLFVQYLKANDEELDVTEDVAWISELDMRKRHKRRFIATRNILAKEKICWPGNVEIYRSILESIDHVSPFDFEMLSHSIARIDISRGYPILRSEVEVSASYLNKGNLT